MFIVVDIGNTRLKWGLCGPTRIDASVSLPSDDPDAWREQFTQWRLSGVRWAVSSVVPKARQRFVDWLTEIGQPAVVIESAGQLPLRVALDAPECVGIDRLLDAVAANTRRDAGRGAIIVDAGSAVTVDFVDEAGAFRGGAIFPGLRLMAEALHEHTALLPMIDVRQKSSMPGTSTAAAIATGVFHAVAGGIDRLVEELGSSHHLFLTGGDARSLGPHLRHAADVWPEMTVEGIRMAALNLTGNLT